MPEPIPSPSATTRRSPKKGKARRAPLAQPPSILADHITRVPLDALTPHPRNPRQGDVGAIVESLDANGQYAPIIVQRATGYILAGNHRYLAARAAGMTEIATVYVDVDDEHALRILLADNRTSDRASYDTAELLALLNGVLTDTGSLYGTAYEKDDLDELLELVDPGGGAAARSSRLLAAVEVTIADPKHDVNRGDVWMLDQHVLVCVDLITEWPAVLPYLTDPERDLLCAHPGPLVPLTDRAADMRLVLVQPDPYIAGHMLDRYVETRGPEQVTRVLSGIGAPSPR